MTVDARSIDAHYGSGNLAERIRAALGTGPVSRESLAELDEFHLRGREATRELATLAGLAPDMRVLDLGCGLGGPARTFAAEFGCVVDGVEIVPSFCAAAELLNRLTGWTDRVTIHRADMRRLPFPAGSFDRAGTLHTLVNVPDLPGLLAEVRRVLAPGGAFFFYEVCRTGEAALDYPVPWASDAALDHAGTAESLRAAVEEAGFVLEAWNDVTSAILAWFEALASAGRTGPRPKAPGPTLGLVMGPDAGLKSRNLRRNIASGRLRVVTGRAPLLPRGD